MNERIAVIGLGYVGLPLALAFARKFPGTVGFDINPGRVEALRHGVDHTGEVPTEDLRGTALKITSTMADLAGTTFFVISVPTPIDRNNRPDMDPLITASEIVAKLLKPGAVIVYESTVYPGVTEEICGSVLGLMSGLEQGVDFKLAYSPERVNPGDRKHTLEQIIKVVA